MNLKQPGVVMRHQANVFQNHGFTLIELMIVIAMVTILTTLALPSFQDRIIRTQVEEALNLARFARTAVDEYYQHEGKLPADNAAAGLPVKDKIIGNYVHQLEIISGTINVTLGKRANQHIVGKILTIRPAIVPDATIVPIAWVCGKAQAPDGMSIAGANATSLDNVHLPLDCRQLSSAPQ
jgi:type IV pilus assembly protein PilA